MKSTPMIIHYVTDIAASTAFYADALNAPVLYEADDFTMLKLGDGARLGLWRRSEVQPPVGDAQPGASELNALAPDLTALTAMHDRLAGQGATILHPVMALPFGQAFMLADPDGHRLRVYVPAADPQ
ncbi:VOC family protein [Pararhodobacter marinus]|uniref:VOC family protein n=1 Tax=Pararhodobacter marinus TaxID=2184063 RepID=UPI003519B95B